MQCIFCRQNKHKQTRIEHIVPESLGGSNWACLSPGIVCDSCNQYFGSKVERPALEDFPLNVIRLFNGIVTKKKKWSTLNHYHGLLRASPIIGLIGIDPLSEAIEEALLQGRISQLRILAETSNPIALCRLMLKIGLEAIAHESISTCLASKYDGARQFARAPRPGSSWWVLHHGEAAHSVAISHEHSARIGVSIVPVEDCEIALISLFSFDFIAPLSERIQAVGLELLPQPQYRLYSVTI